MTFTRLAAASDLVEDEPFSVDLGQYRRVALIKSRGQLYAIEDQCSHARILLSVGAFDADDRTIECYGHGARFDLGSGEPLDLPATVAVPVYPIKIDGEDVLVDLDNPIQEPGCPS